MEPQNTYTYRQSEVPPINDEVQSEIAEIDFTVANLILKIQGNYLALSALAETLADGLNNAELNLCSIRIIPDGGEPELLPRAIGLTDLPTLEKQMIVSNAITGTVAIQILASTLSLTFDQAADYVQNLGLKHIGTISPEKLEEVVEKLANSLRETPEAEKIVIDFEIQA
jgi:hypothetical protein